MRRFEWDSIRALGSNRLVQLTVVLPVIGYLILFSSSLRQYFVLFVDPGTEPVFWRLYLLYFGFCFLAVGSLIFAWRCPSEVKTHGAGFAYLEREGSAISEARLQSIRQHVMHAYFRARYGVRAARKFFDETRPGKSRTPGDVEEQYFNWLETLEQMQRSDLLLEYFVALKQSRTVWRFASRLCYDMGFGLLAIPTLDVFLAVVRTVYQEVIAPF